MEQRFKDVGEKIDRLTERVTMLFVGAGLLAFAIPIASPFIRDILHIGN